MNGENDLNSRNDVSTPEQSRLQLQELQSQIGQLSGRIEKLEKTNHPISVGYLLGTAIAVTLSWSKNASILWCIFHGTFSWGYVIYFAVMRHS